MTAIKPAYLRFLATVLLFALAMGLRLGAVNNTIIDAPIRADATDYYNYALNLKFHHTYSRQKFSDNTPQPDALRAPGYPAFLTPFVEHPPTAFMLWKINFAQALLDSITVLLALGIFRRIMPEGWALGAAFLTAISPHLISAGTYLLTETLFTFLMMLSLWLLAIMISRNSKLLAVTAGIVIAAAALTRPTLQFFVIPVMAVLLVSHDRSKHARLVFPLLIGFALAYAPWVMRNLDAIGSSSDPTLTINALHHGMYPDFRYQDIPESTGFPYRFDPNSKAVSSSKETILEEIRRRFEDEPARHLQWYLLGKPTFLLDWNILAGMGDVFIYPIIASPYFSQPVYALTHKFMKMLHWPLVILALAASVLVWIPGFGKKLPGSTLLTARLLSVVLFYFIALHIVAAPFPRYGIPLRPVIYGLGIFQCWQILAWIKSALSRESLQPRTQPR
jgi:4-amino-4-deoxy-L-arabinose transferase-like glycosyltransferase